MGNIYPFFFLFFLNYIQNYKAKIQGSSLQFRSTVIQAFNSIKSYTFDHLVHSTCDTSSSIFMSCELLIESPTSFNVSFTCEKRQQFSWSCSVAPYILKLVTTCHGCVLVITSISPYSFKRTRYRFINTFKPYSLLIIN